MRVLVTGASGQVGRELIRRASSHAGMELLAMTRDELDLGRREDISRALQAHAPDFVINAAAYTAVDRAEVEPALAERINGQAPGWIGAACAAAGIPVIHFSTDYVFPGDQPGARSEDDATGPRGAYGSSKLAGEHNLLASGASCLILRVSWVFAAHGVNFMRTMLRLGAEREELRVVADQRGGPTWAGHIAEAALRLAARHGAGQALPGGIYHYSGAPTVSWHAFAETILRRAHERSLLARLPRVLAIATKDYPTRAPRPANSELDCRRIEARLGLLQPDWPAGLEACLDECLASPPS